MLDLKNNNSEREKEIDWDIIDYFHFEDQPFLSLFDDKIHDDTNIKNEENELPSNEQQLIQVTKPDSKKSINKSSIKKINIFTAKPKYMKKLTLKNNCSNNKFNFNSDLHQFIEYLNLKINKDKNIKITKETIIYLYQRLQFFFHIEPLTRNEKRDKKKIYIRLFKHSATIIDCFERNPQILLYPVFSFCQFKFNQRKTKFRRVIQLKKTLNIH